MNRSTLLAALVLVHATACNTGENIPPPTPQSLETCVKGWWLGPDISPCACSFAQNPECARADCQQRAFEGYLDGGHVYGGVFMYSPSAKTMSTVAEMTAGTYTVSDAGVTVTPPGKVGATKCSSQSLTKSYSSLVRAPATFSTTLDRATKGGAEKTFRGERVD